MNATEVRDLLGYLGEAFPSLHVSDDTLRVWVNALGRVEALDGYAAAVAWVDHSGSSFAPSCAELIARAKNCAAARAPAYQALPEGGTLTRAESAARARLLRGAYVAVAEAVPTHRHHDGAENCPACSTRDERADNARIAVEAVRAAEERPAEHRGER